MSIVISRTRAVVAGALMLFAVPALAQQAGGAAPQGGQAQQPPGPVTVDLVGVQPEWTKVCGPDQQTKKEICYITRDFGPQADQPLVSFIVYDMKGADQPSMRLLVPLGLSLKPGFRYSIDKGAQESGDFLFCFQNGCFAEAKFKQPTVDALKKDGKLVIIMKNMAKFDVTLNLPLAGFGKAYDGPAIDPKVLEEQQKKLEEDLKKRAEEEKKKLEAKPAGK